MMDKLQRYDLVGCYDRYIDKQEYGDWVYGDDAETRIADLEAQLAEQKEWVKDLADLNVKNEAEIADRERRLAEVNGFVLEEFLKGGEEWAVGRCGETLIDVHATKQDGATIPVTVTVTERKEK